MTAVHLHRLRCQHKAPRTFKGCIATTPGPQTRSWHWRAKTWKNAWSGLPSAAPRRVVSNPEDVDGETERSPAAITASVPSSAPTTNPAPARHDAQVRRVRNLLNEVGYQALGVVPGSGRNRRVGRTREATGPRHQTLRSSSRPEQRSTSAVDIRGSAMSLNNDRDRCSGATWSPSRKGRGIYDETGTTSTRRRYYRRTAYSRVGCRRRRIHEELLTCECAC